MNASVCHRVTLLGRFKLLRDGREVANRGHRGDVSLLQFAPQGSLTIGHLQSRQVKASASEVNPPCPFCTQLERVCIAKAERPLIIMSLGGLALAIGVLVDASIVMVENAYRHLSEPDEAIAYEDQPRVIIGAAKQVARAIFFSRAIITHVWRNE